MMRIARSLAVMALAVPSVALAGVLVFSGLSTEKAIIEAAPKEGKDVSYVKIEGVESPWAGKVIKTRKTSGPNGDRYSFEYDLELSSGVQKRTYTIISDHGYELKSGSRVKKIQMFYQGMPDKKKGVELDYDEAATKASQGIGLPGEYARKPFKPNVD